MPQPSNLAISSSRSRSACCSVSRNSAPMTPAPSPASGAISPKVRRLPDVAPIARATFPCISGVVFIFPLCSNRSRELWPIDHHLDVRSMGEWRPTSGSPHHKASLRCPRISSLASVSSSAPRPVPSADKLSIRIWTTCPYGGISPAQCIDVPDITLTGIRVARWSDDRPSRNTVRDRLINMGSG
jgi:hypothetical protein